MNRSDEREIERVMETKKENYGKQIEYTKEDEWRIVAATVDRCLFIVFIVVFVSSIDIRGAHA